MSFGDHKITASTFIVWNLNIHIIIITPRAHVPRGLIKHNIIQQDTNFNHMQHINMYMGYFNSLLIYCTCNHLQKYKNAYK